MSPSRPVRYFSSVLAVASLAMALRISAQESTLAADVQWSLLCKVLTYDRNFVENHPSKIVVWILYQPRYRVSVNVKNEIAAAIAQSKAANELGTTVEVLPVDVGTLSDIQNSFLRRVVTVAYLAPMRGVHVDDIAATCRAQHILTMTGTPEYVEQGVSVAIATRGGRPNIVIGLASAKASGADFSSQLLKIATVLP